VKKVRKRTKNVTNYFNAHTTLTYYFFTHIYTFILILIENPINGLPNLPEVLSVLIGGDGNGGVCSLVVVARCGEAFGTRVNFILRAVFCYFSFSKNAAHTVTDHSNYT